MLNVPLVSLTNREPLLMAVPVSVALPWFVSFVASRIKSLPVKALVTTVPPKPVKVPLLVFKRATVKAVGPESSVP